MKRRIIIAFLFFAFFTALIWLFLPAGPSYQGKPLRYWLAFYTLYVPGSSPEHQDQVDEAVREIGTNGIPTLLEMLQEKDPPPSKVRWRAILWILRIIPQPQPASRHHLQAARAFQVLGADASNAVPALVQIYHRKISPSSQQQTLEALRGIGPSALATAAPVLLDGLTNSSTSTAGFAISEMHGQSEVFVPALINALKDPNDFVRSSAARTLAKYGPAAKPAVPALIPLLNDPDWNVHRFAADALKKIDPEAAVPALINALKDSNVYVRSDAAWGLAAYGPAAKTAVPVLVDLYKNDPDPAVRADVAYVLKKIDSVAAAEAGVK